jgi:hypothetical protein
MLPVTSVKKFYSSSPWIEKSQLCFILNGLKTVINSFNESKRVFSLADTPAPV